jgi:ATP-dependent Clp protease ATP-binding subunit ClpX
MGFGAEIQSKREKDVGVILKEVESHDLIKFGFIPELAGRLPFLVTLDSLDREAFIRILSEPKNALVKQYKKLLKSTGGFGVRQGGAGGGRRQGFP